MSIKIKKRLAMLTSKAQLQYLIIGNIIPMALERLIIPSQIIKKAVNNSKEYLTTTTIAIIEIIEATIIIIITTATIIVREIIKITITISLWIKRASFLKIIQ